MGCSCRKHRVAPDEEAVCRQQPKQFPDDSGLDDMYGGRCPLADWLPEVPSDFGCWKEKMLSKYHAAWEKAGCPIGIQQNDHNFDTSLGQGNTLAFVAARLTILPGLEERLRHGLFAEPGTYPAVVRFSDFGEDASTTRMARMAVKVPLLGAWPGQANLLFTETMDTFPLADYDALRFFTGNSSKKACNGLRSLCGILRVLVGQNFTKVARGRAFRDEVLAKSYYGQLPYMLGEEHVMKFQLIPKQVTRSGCKASDPDLFLPPTRAPANKQQALEWARQRSNIISEYLSQNDACFELQLQVKEKASNEHYLARRADMRWKEKPIVVGTLTIMKQDCTTEHAVGTKLQSAISAELGLNPSVIDKAFTFHPIATHESNRPIGQVNHFRLGVYGSGAQVRIRTIHKELGGADHKMPFESLRESSVFGPLPENA